MRFKLTRDQQIPQGAIKVQDKQSSAVAYLYTGGPGRPAAMVFSGKADKPAWRYYFAGEKARDKSIQQHFESVRAWEKRRADAQSERKSWQHDYKVGDVFGTCWGYDQTNREYFQCIEVKGKHLVLREIAQATKSTVDDSWNTVPLVGQFIGAPIRRLASKHGVKIDDVRRASYQEPKVMGGVPVYTMAHASNGH